MDFLEEFPKQISKVIPNKIPKEIVKAILKEIPIKITKEIITSEGISRNPGYFFLKSYVGMLVKLF